MASLDSNNAVVFMPISMAKIEGSQDADALSRVTLKTLYPLINTTKDTTDVCFMTTEGLYAANANEPSHDVYDRLWRMGDQFRRKYFSAMFKAKAQYERLRPEAHQQTTFDALRLQTELFRQAVGELKSQYNGNRIFAAQIDRDILDMGRDVTPENRNFLFLEYALMHLINTGKIKINQILRTHDKGQMICVYPDKQKQSELMAYKLLDDQRKKFGQIDSGRALFINPTSPKPYISEVWTSIRSIAL